ncbi:Protein kinase, catalytic domain-containing protein [Rozella allomycis CSF55]|uniref:Protein kinase, catalytic domain-containing protein n=1 Tax=Rozella allomycis (strain CSF55) TaxID=988480 RepID=A0A075B481_ROZAC|nr:Protein kinase, catalytic domain-containing protein [Rozella allomycis CSF55]|eukprot:EPZ35966.1 Protein kinase, catalytic domain-containing protein [Rozella allomycis CSF55]
MKIIGQGAFAKVYEIFDEHRHETVAVKVLNANYTHYGLNDIRGSCLIRLLDAFVIGYHCFLVFPLHTSYGIHDFSTYFQKALKSKDTNKIGGAWIKLSEITYQLLKALSFLKVNEWIHADIKVDNILFLNDFHQSVKLSLIDFGNSMPLSDAPLYYDDYEVQNPSYRAPEVTMGMPFKESIDMWSLGCVLGECVTGSVIFEEGHRLSFHLFPSHIYQNSLHWNNYKTLLGTSLHRNYDLPSVCMKRKLCGLLGVSNIEFLDILSKMFEYDPNQRITPDEALSHPFLAEFRSQFTSYRNAETNIKSIRKKRKAR